MLSILKKVFKKKSPLLFRRSIECITAIYLFNKIIQLSFNLLFKQYCMELSLKQIRIFLTTYYMGAFEAKVIFLMDALIQNFWKGVLLHSEIIEWVLHSTRSLGVLCLCLCQKDLYANSQWFVLLLSLRIDGTRKWSKVMAPALQQMKVNVLQGVQHASLRQPPDGRNCSVHDLTFNLLSWPSLAHSHTDNIANL